MREFDYDEYLRDLENLRKEFNGAIDSLEQRLKADAKLSHIKLRNDVDHNTQTIKEHRNLFLFIGGAVGMGVIGAVLKVIGL